MNFSRVKPRTVPQFLFCLALIVLTITNSVVLKEEIRRIYNYKKILDFNVVGYQFAGIEAFLKDVEYMGYYTDKDMDDPKNAKLFAHAQFALAPIVLDFNNLNHKYIIFACSSDGVAHLEMNKIKAIALGRNQFGIVIAQRQ